MSYSLTAQSVSQSVTVSLCLSLSVTHPAVWWRGRFVVVSFLSFCGFRFLIVSRLCVFIKRNFSYKGAARFDDKTVLSYTLLKYSGQQPTETIRNVYTVCIHYLRLCDFCEFLVQFFGAIFWCIFWTARTHAHTLKTIHPPTHSLTHSPNHTYSTPKL